MKKIVALLCALLLSVSCFSACDGCAPNPPEGEVEGVVDPSAPKETLPDYLEQDEKEFNIGMWVGIPEQRSILDEYDRVTGTEAWTQEAFEEQYRWIAEAGFTIASSPTGISSPAHILRSLDAAEKAGIKRLVWDERVKTVLLNTMISDKEAIQQARRIMAEYSDHPAFCGNMITDEPQMREYDALGVGARRYKEAFPDKMYYLNLFPVVATSEQLGTDSYDTYLSAYVEKVSSDYLCYDHYPLLPAQGGGSRFVDDFLYNMELAQKHMEESKGEVWTFLQSMGYSIKKDPDCVEDFRAQVAASLAYGLKGIQWFCYYSPGYGGNEGFTPAIITLDGKKTAKYDMVKEVNNEILAFDDVYLNFEWQRAMTFVGSENASGKNAAFNYLTTVNEHERIADMKNTQDLVAGVFQDADGRDGFLFANYDAPTSSAVNALRVAFDNCTQAVCYINGEKREVAVNNGVVNLELNAGDYAFIIPLNL